MELMWLVYAVENLTYNGNFLIKLIYLLMALTLAALFITGLVYADDKVEDKNFSNWWKNVYPTKTIIILATVALLLHTLLPTRDTAIKMAGAYLLQSVVTNDKTKELGDAAYRATLRQLNKWAEEVPELADMLLEEGKQELRTKVDEIKSEVKN